MSKLSSGRWVAYLISIGLVVAATLVGSLLKSLPFFEPTDADILYILAVSISAAYLGFGPSILSSFLGVFACDFFFIAPVFTFTVASEKDTFNLIMMFIASAVISFLSPRLHR